MKNTLVVLMLLAGLAVGCKSNRIGEKVKEPFSSSKYMSNKRYWRSTGSGSSSDLNIAKQKAQLEARKNLASQIETNLKSVGDQYIKNQEIGERELVQRSFEQLYREVLNTRLNDAVIHDQVTYKRENGQFIHYVAMEAHKKNLYRHMKRMNEANTQLNPKQRAIIEKMIDEQLATLED
ncbi:MAG: hypothetical protein ACK417_12115 [Bacteroidia bacterium]|jgi:hypothetical protein